jgi:hypothetical protein
MFITSSFGFVHLHKSGGTFVNAFLMNFFPDGRRLNWHLPLSFMPEAERSLPILGVVRNPWDYYVSWFAFQSKMPPHKQNAVYRAVSDDGELGFGPTITNLVNLADDPDRFARIRSQLPETFADRGINLTRTCLDPLAGSGLGFYSFLFHRMFSRRVFGDISGVTFARMESLRVDLLAYLPRVGVDVTAGMRDYVLHSEKKNVTEHAPFPTYYEPEPQLHALVAARDRDVIDRFGYGFSPG